MSWLSSLRPASFRGVPFSVLGGEAVLGRRTVVHEYPFRDDVWVEDLGSGKKVFTLTGWLVGDDVISRRQELQAAVDTAGIGELVHPTHGNLQVVCTDFRAAEKWDAGRVIEVAFTFIPSGQRLFPGTTGGGLGDALGDLADAADLAVSGDFLGGVGDALSAGGAAISSIVNTAQTYAGTAQRLVGDAARVLHSVGGLVPGLDKTLGRYTSGARSIIGQVQSGIGSTTSYINQAATARSAVERTSGDVLSAVRRL